MKDVELDGMSVNLVVSNRTGEKYISLTELRLYLLKVAKKNAYMPAGVVLELIEKALEQMAK